MKKFFRNPNKEPSDWFSPILVKELRQGMRGKVFLSSFLLLQLAMIFGAAGSLVSASLQLPEQASFFNGFFWFIIGIPLVFIIPSLGSKALQTEIDTKSLELVSLTHLTPWRVVAGKWTALFAQALLLVSAVLPYLVLRYFLGGIDLLFELGILFALLLACAVVTAFTVGFSASGKGWMRGLMLIFFILFWQFLLAVMVAGPGFFGISHRTGWAENPYILSTFFVPLLVLLLLEIGTRKISPPARPRSASLRILGLLFLLVAAGFELAGADGIAFSFVSIPLLGIAIAVLTESTSWIRSIYNPYVRKGPIGKLIGRTLFYPGWQSGFIYVTLIALLYLGLWFHLDSGIETGPFMLVFAILIFPVAVTRLFARDTEKGFACFIILQLIQVVLAMIGIFLNHSYAGGIELAFSIFPTSQAIMLTWDLSPLWELENFLITNQIVILISLAILAVRAFSLRKLISQMEESAIRPRPAKTETAPA